ncbi:carbonic anhydrase 2-like [Planococcus citri]|uniref:carbonic anhydrase 2-like n=1 Tax=Planococcus citri TaxID=170843 RepID=UPI0031F7805B
MYFPKIYFLLCLSCCGELTLARLRFHPDNPDASQLFLGRFPITSKQTNDPINIKSESATNVGLGGLKPFSLHASFSDNVKVQNNGNIVKVVLQEPFTTSGVTGGVLGDDIYLFEEIKYLWTDDMEGTAATTVDGIGYPLENIAIFFNKKYGSFENALNHRDGLVEVDFRIGICSIPNLLFENYAPILKQVQKAGSIAYTTLGTAIEWFAAISLILPIDSYYSYPGSYFNKTQNKRYYSATVIIFPHALGMCLTPHQFKETFGSFKNSSGQPLTNTESQFPQKMPVVRARGILNLNTP